MWQETFYFFVAATATVARRTGAAAAAATIPLTFWRLEPSQEISFSSLPVEPTFLWSMHVWITRGIFVSCLLSIMADKENSFHYIYTFCLGLATVVALCKAKLTRSRQCVPNRSIYMYVLYTLISPLGNTISRPWSKSAEKINTLGIVTITHILYTFRKVLSFLRRKFLKTKENNFAITFRQIFFCLNGSSVILLPCFVS